MKSIIPNKMKAYEAVYSTIKKLRESNRGLKENYIIMKLSYFNIEVGPTFDRIHFTEKTGIIGSLVGVPCYIADDTYYNEVIGEASNFIATSDKDYYDKIVLALKAKKFMED